MTIRRYQGPRITFDAVRWAGENLEEIKEFLLEYGWGFQETENDVIYIEYSSLAIHAVLPDFVLGERPVKYGKNSSITIKRYIQVNDYVAVDIEKPATLAGHPEKIFREMICRAEHFKQVSRAEE